jgi:EAL domain-containing protein (putative c-di-GMP-specific phosphodiesterase class I)
MPEARLSEVSAGVAYLEHYPAAGDGAHRLLLDRFPYCIGRSSAAHYCISSPQVSKEHVQIVRDGDRFRIRDLGSTNGTFVNGERVQEAVLNHGDIVHVAHKEFRFGQESAALPSSSEVVGTDHASSHMPVSAIQNTEHLKQLLRSQSVRILFQPIVDLRTGQAAGYEALGRGTHDRLNPSPAFLFSLAAQSNLGPELSRLFRRTAVREVAKLPPNCRIFLNLHRSELRDAAFLKTLEGLPDALGGGREAVIELHEEAVANTAAMRRLRERLSALGIGLAYDDFGAGQARLSELADVPPDFLKLDRTLVDGLHRAPARQELVRALTRVSTGLGIRLIAEGIENADEAEVCRDLGCHFGQGYFFGRPQPGARFSAV